MMLKEEQVAELLRRCEAIAGQYLGKTRGNLKASNENRVSGIWELLVLEAASKLGQIEHEPRKDGSNPDVCLELFNEKIWIEAAFLSPRFWNLERDSSTVFKWLMDLAESKGIPKYKVSCQFEGDLKNSAGPVRLLPFEHEKKSFYQDEIVSEFFRAVKQQPEQRHQLRHDKYSIIFEYHPQNTGPYVRYGGLVQESPREIKEHALYRLLRDKVSQHELDESYVICIGSDQSPILSLLANTRYPSVREVIYEVFRQHESVSAVIICSIEDTVKLGRASRSARTELYIHPSARLPLSDVAVESLKNLNFNRWRYCPSMPLHKSQKMNFFYRCGGSITMNHKSSDAVEVEIPSNVLLDCLSGKTTLADEYGEGFPGYKQIQEGWEIASCALKDGDIEKCEPSKIVLGFSPPYEHVFRK